MRNMLMRTGVMIVLCLSMASAPVIVPAEEETAVSVEISSEDRQSLDQYFENRAQNFFGKTSADGWMQEEQLQRIEALQQWMDSCEFTVESANVSFSVNSILEGNETETVILGSEWNTLQYRFGDETELRSMEFETPHLLHIAKATHEITSDCYSEYTGYEYGSKEELAYVRIGEIPGNLSGQEREEDQILVQTDSDTISVYDAADGSLVSTLPGRLAEATGSMLLKEGAAASVCDDKTKEFQIYISGESELRPEKYQYLRFLTDTLYTDSSADLNISGDLYEIPDIKVSSQQGIFQRAGDYIFTEDSIYDLDGKLLGTHPAFTFVYGMPEDNVLGCDLSSGTYVMFDCKNLEVLWTEDQMSYADAAGGTISWTTASGEGLITDLDHTEIISEADWKSRNADRNPDGTNLTLISKNPETGDAVLRLKADDGMHYYICDDQMNIREDLAAAQVSVCWKDGTQIPLKWSAPEDGVLALENLWTGESIRIPVDLGTAEIADVTVTGAGNVYGVLIVTRNPDGRYGIITTSEEVISGPTENVLAETVLMEDAATVKVMEYTGSSQTVKYLDPDGNALADQDVIYADQDRICVSDGDGISVLPR